MAGVEHLRLFPLAQRVRKRQRFLPLIYFRSSNVCTVCAMRQEWRQQQRRRHLDVQRVATIATAKAARPTDDSATSLFCSRAISSSATQSASSRRGDRKRIGVIENLIPRKSIAQGNVSTSTLSAAFWHPPSSSIWSPILFPRKESSSRILSSQCRALSSRQASSHSLPAAPIPTTPPNAANIVNTDNTANSSPTPAGSSASQLRNLYNALKQLSKSSATSIHVDSNRLNLAIKGIEDSLRGTNESMAAGSGPVIRMAVLGLGNQQLTRRLVRLLLADPLSKEEEWEKQLDSAENDDGRGILLRYGDRPNLTLHNRLLYNFNIPSLFLQKNNLEILINTLDSTSANHQTTGETATKNILNPMLLAPSSAIDRQTAITFPVHTTLIVGQGLESCITFGRLSAGHRQTSPFVERIKFVMLGTSNPISDTLGGASQSATFATSDDPSHQKVDKDKTTEAEYAQVDVGQATEALSLFRKSAANSSIYEQGWHQAHMPQLMDWIRSQCAGSTDTSLGKESLKPAVRALVTSIVADAHVSIGKAQARLQESKDALLIPSATRQSLNKALDAWADLANKEVRDKLDKAFASKAWQDLSWWKIVWKAEDVGRVALDILTHEWLVTAEQEIIYLCGRMEEAGYHFIDSDGDWKKGGNNRNNGAKKSVPLQHNPTLKYQPPSLPPYQTVSDSAQMHNDSAYVQADAEDVYLSDDMEQRSSRTSGALAPPPLSDGPWPSPIPEARISLVYNTVSPLHRKAQMLFLKYVASISGSLMLGGLLSGTSFVGTYEASSVALVGAVWGVWRFQKTWEAERLRWADNVREMGRGAVRETEVMVREILGEQTKKRTSEFEAGKKSEGDGSNVNDGNFEAKLLAEAAKPAEKALRALEKIS